MRHSARQEVIELRLREAAQLFNSLDPSPFRERDLDVDAEAYIVGWARELPRDAELCLVIQLPAAEAAEAARHEVPRALAHYFADRAAATGRDLRELFRNGRRYLAIGAPVLLACLLASQLAGASLGPGTLGRMVEESLIIVGWVANWRPIETFLYDWWPLKRRRDLYLRLAAAKVEIKSMRAVDGAPR